MDSGATSTSPRFSLDRGDDATRNVVGRTGTDSWRQFHFRVSDHPRVTDEPGEHNGHADAAVVKVGT